MAVDPTRRPGKAKEASRKGRIDHDVINADLLAFFKS
jgi:hypothetical protein